MIGQLIKLYTIYDICLYIMYLYTQTYALLIKTMYCYKMLGFHPKIINKSFYIIYNILNVKIKK